MNLQVAMPTIWMLRGVGPAKLGTARGKLPDRVATHFGLSLQPGRWSSKGEPSAIIVIAVLGQAAPATFVLLRVDSAAGPIELPEPNHRRWRRGIVRRVLLEGVWHYLKG